MAKTITVDLPDRHQEILERYCELADQKQTAVIKDLILTVLRARVKSLEDDG